MEEEDGEGTRRQSRRGASRTCTARKGGRSLRVKWEVLRSTERHSLTVALFPPLPPVGME
uniref:Uncharacterized protein n=1 Tax=Amphilophus citrinellus TaxID=61819 RepID=A0A3Q0R1C8_AMPCI